MSINLTNGSYIQQLVNYIKKNLSKGYTIDSLRFALQDQGYGRSEINRAIDIANLQLAKKAPKLKEKPIIKVERIPIKYEETKPKKKSWFSKLFNSY